MIPRALFLVIPKTITTTRTNTRAHAITAMRGVDKEGSPVPVESGVPEAVKMNRQCDSLTATGYNNRLLQTA